MELLYGTANPGKLSNMKEILSDIGVEIIGLIDLEDKTASAEEKGDTPLENAIIKAKAYYKAYKRPVFSCDSGLYLDGVSEEEQPGVYVRRVKGKVLTDEEMIEHYGNLALKAGGCVKARYRNAICLIIDDKHMFKYDGLEIASEEFLITSIPHKRRIEGFPLDSLSIDIKSNSYYMDLSDFTEEDKKMRRGFIDFFKRALML